MPPRMYLSVLDRLIVDSANLSANNLRLKVGHSNAALVLHRAAMEDCQDFQQLFATAPSYVAMISSEIFLRTVFL